MWTVRKPEPRCWTCLALIIAMLVMAACRGGDSIPEVSVRAELVGGAPVEVAATGVRDAEGGTLYHGVRVTWRGSEPVRLDDVRFSHHVQEEDGHLVTAGRGCGANWDSASNEVFIACTMDLRLIELRPGETHEYPVSVYPSIGRLRLTGGTYVTEEEIAWWRAGDLGDTPQGRFTVRLTYEVR
jgi:hypothetical protein